MKRNYSRGYWLDKRDDEWLAYFNDPETEEGFEIDKIFEDFKSSLWSALLRGYKAAQQKMHQTAFGVLLVVFFVGFSCGAIIFNGLCGGW